MRYYINIEIVIITIIKKEELIMNLKGTKTEKNLMAGFAGESEARNKYTYYASKARKEGYNQIVLYLKKLLTMKRNMLNYGLNFYMMVCLQQRKI